MVLEIATMSTFKVIGRVLEVRGAIIRVTLRGAKLGAICGIDCGDAEPLRARIMALVDGHAVLSPFAYPTGVSIGADVHILEDELKLRITDDLLGRTLDAFLEPIDGHGDVPAVQPVIPIDSTTESAMLRPIISEVFESGVRAVDGICTLGVGQRVGVFGPPGTGKTSFIGMLARNCIADVVVVALVGERGREVREFVEDVLPSDKRKRAVVIAATSDRPALERSTCAMSAMAVADYFRNQGKSVFLLIDSVTRMARALREIGLAAGEAPTRRGYPASVYPALPLLIEKAGRGSKGDITAIYTVLTEGEIEDDPIAEEVKSLTDGHLILSPELAKRGHYPALDILASLSRLMDKIADPNHTEDAATIRKQLAKFQEVEMLVQMGEYQRGNDPECDSAIDNIPRIEAFLTQRPNERTPFSRTAEGLRKIARA